MTRVVGTVVGLRTGASVVVVVVAAACFPTAPPDTTLIACTSNAECFGDQVCSPAQVCADVDNVPPGPIADLAVDDVVQPPTETSVTLTWTAPGDDGGAADTSALRYRLRITPANGAPVEQTLPLAPQSAGARETFVVTPLAPATRFGFVVVALDEFDNGLDSNVAEGFTVGDIACTIDGDCPSGFVCPADGGGVCAPVDAVAPGVIGDLAVAFAATTSSSVTLTFHAPGDDGFDGGGAAARYDVLVDNAAATAPIEVDAPVPGAAFTPQSIVVDGLEAGSTHSFIVVATDEAGNASQSLAVTAEVGGALCADDAPVVGDLLASTDAHLVRLAGCTHIANSLTLDMRDCTLTSFALLDELESVDGVLTLISNPLCAGNDDVDAFPNLTHVGRLELDQTAAMVSVRLPALATADVIDVNQPLRLTSLQLPALTDAGLVVIEGIVLADLDLSSLQSADDLQFFSGGGGDGYAVSLPSLETAGEIVADFHLASLDAPVLATVTGGVGIGTAGGAAAAAGMRSLSMPALTTIAGALALTPNSDVALEVFDFGALDSAGSVTIEAIELQGLPAFTSTLSFPALTQVTGDFIVDSISDVTEIHAPLLLSAGNGVSFAHLPSLHVIDLASVDATVLSFSDLGDAPIALPALTTSPDITISDGATPSVSLDALATVDALRVQHLDDLTVVSAPSLTAAGTIELEVLPALESVDFTSLAVAHELAVFLLASLTSLSLPSLAATSTPPGTCNGGGFSGAFIAITDCAALDTLELPQLGFADVINLSHLPALTSVALGASARLGDTSIEDTGDDCGIANELEPHTCDGRILCFDPTHTEVEPNDDGAVSPSANQLGNDFDLAAVEGPFSATTIIHGSIAPVGDEDAFEFLNVGAVPLHITVFTLPVSGLPRDCDFDIRLVQRLDDGTADHSTVAGSSSEAGCTSLDDFRDFDPNVPYIVHVMANGDNAVVDDYLLVAIIE